VRKAERKLLEDRIIKKITRDGPFLTRELADYFGMGVSTIDQLLNRLVREGRIAREGTHRILWKSS